jgi:hypothetical protein
MIQHSNHQDNKKKKHSEKVRDLPTDLLALGDCVAGTTPVGTIFSLSEIHPCSI